MSVLTEAALRILLKDADLDAMAEYRVEKDVIVTPAARAWLTDHKIDLIIGEKKVIKNPSSQPAVPDIKPEQERKSVLPDFEKPPRYTGVDGCYYQEKPEHMTALYGNQLVSKQHPRIVLRGKIDSLTASIVQAQFVLLRLNMKKGSEALGEVLKYLQDILRCEVLNIAVEPVSLFGMDEKELHDRSHFPKKFYGIPHFAASVEDGEAVAALNFLRTASREVEIAACGAFLQPGGVLEREDIITALNRLSSIFYVMMFQTKAGVYNEG